MLGLDPRPLVRVVLDTNVLVSAMLGPGRVPDQLLSLLVSQRIAILYDARIRAEYADVVMRPKFRAIPVARRERLLAEVSALGVEPSNIVHYEGPLDDDDDRMFVEVARAGAAYALVTGNLRDYPTSVGFPVLPPATALAELGALLAR
jgi:uncharacterized protein